MQSLLVIRTLISNSGRFGRTSVTWTFPLTAQTSLQPSSTNQATPPSTKPQVQSPKPIAQPSRGGTGIQSQTKSAQPPRSNQPVRIQRRRAHQVFVHTHQRAGPLHGFPQGRGHFQNVVRRVGVCNPGADLVVLLGCEQVQAQHLVNGFHGSSVRSWQLRPGARCTRGRRTVACR
jgi:hypothetical protein